MPHIRWLIVLCSVALGASGVIPAFAQQAPTPVPSAPGAGGWLAGPAAQGDPGSVAGFIDAPANGASLASGTLQVSGWFVDLTAQGWAGADDVEVFADTIESGGKPLGHAQFGQNRSDVAAALKNDFWAASGWSASVPTTALPQGATTISVYVHTPARGWWMRQVSVALRAAPSPATPSPPPAGSTRRTATPTPTPVLPAPTPTVAPTSLYGNDISYPQCPTGAEPAGPAFAIVGVTDGKPFSANPCLPREYFWALGSTSSSQPRVGLYMNTANPGPSASPNWPAAGASTPRACDGTWSTDCAYDYGWLSAQDAFARAVGVVGSAAAAQYPWWLDVEAANSWSSEMPTNAAALQGVVDYLRSVSVASIGVYSTSTDWEALVGPPSAGSGPFGGLLNWRPGPSGPQDAPAWCNRTVTGGKVKFVQFPSGGFDTDFACF